MRNPWPIFSIAALSGAACLIYDHFFSYETMWIAVVAFLMLLALCFFAYCKYERWLAKKLNPYVVAYQSDHNLATKIGSEGVNLDKQAFNAS